MTSPEAGAEAVLRSAAFAAERFLRDDPLRDRIDDVLEHLGRATAADRAYVFRNVRDRGGRLWMDLTHEWLAVDVPHIFEDPVNHLHPYAPDFARWIEVLGEGGTVAGLVEDLPEEAERLVLSGEGVVSVVAVPVACGSEWWGFLGLDHCESGHEHSGLELDAIRTAAAALGAALDREQAVDRARLARDLYRSLIEHVPAITYIDDVNVNASALFMSPQIETMLGYTVAEWIGTPDMWPKILHPDDRARALAENARHNETGEPFSLEYRLFAKDGRIVWVFDQAVLVRDEHGAPRYSHGVMMDISERKRAEEQVAFLAYHDKLTGLPNRTMFEELLELSIARATRHDGSVAVVCVDLDDFRLVNDSLGHLGGDELLRQVADRLRGATRETDLVARRGGDQFLLLLADLEWEMSGDMDTAVIRAESVVQSVADALREPFEVDGTELWVSASMGISLFPQGAPDATTLLREAEAAMYESKKAGPSSYVVSVDGGSDAAGRLAFVTRLRKAAEAQRWVLHYQPVIRLATAEMVGVEALIRWRDPDGTMIPPSEFIPLAEDLGLIEAIGDWCVEEICRQDEGWREQGLRLEISFNLSPRQFWQPDLAERVLSRIAEGGMDPRRMIVEITESSAMLDPDRAQRILWELHAGGLRVAIDDFGTGYSSLSRLREVPVEILKIDRSFVSNVDAEQHSASIVTAFVTLAHGLGMTTLAEGIETEEEWRFLRAQGCQLGQGYLFSRPVPGDQIVELFRRGVIDVARVRTA
ncbi:MAG: EAL domain-containing protein [Actinobacteria bacterium]|nr:EAL domain-containing protein [Actinomycetota bacterium]